MTDIFFQLSIILGLAIVMSLIMKLLRQPLIIGYILTGTLVGPLVIGVISEKESLTALSHIGVALLLFIVGLGLNPKLIKEIGRVAVLTGLGQIIFTSVVGFGLAQLLGLDFYSSLYLSVAFSLSSTIIVLRILYQKGEQDSLYGRISIGFLLVQDLFAMLAFLILSTSSQIGTGEYTAVVFSLLLKFLLICLGLYVLMKYINPHIDKVFAENREMLFVYSLGICFVLASIFYKLNFSFELGALAAGVILSVSPYQREIANRIQPLRDFFLIIFFIVLGVNIDFSTLGQYWLLIIAFSLFIIIGNPIIMIIIMRAMKYTTRTSFLTGVTVSQISEFSFILLGMGVGLGHISQSLLGPATIVGIVTIIASSYFMMYNNRLFKLCERPLKFFFPDKNRRQEIEEKPKNYEVLLFGVDITGSGLLKIMTKEKTSFLAIDHNPEIVKKLTNAKIPCLYGSADDCDLIDTLPVKKVKMVISTIPDVDVNLALVDAVKKIKKSITIICVANHFRDAERLYDAGTTYVVMPPYLGRRFLNQLFVENKFNAKKYKAEKAKHVWDYQSLKQKI